MRIVIFILSVCFFYCGCNRSEEYDFRGKVPESRLVIYAYAETDSLLYAEISKSRTYTDNTELDSTLNIRCQAYVNDLYSGELRPIGNNRYLSDIRPKVGDKITIKVSCTGLEDATASTIVCSPFPEIELDTFRNWNMLQLRIGMQDQGDSENYYRLVVENETFYRGSFRRNGHVKIDSSITYAYDVDLSGDKLFSKEIVSTIWGKEINTNPYQVFTNKTFRGKKQILQASITYPYSYERNAWAIENKDTIRFVKKEYHRLRVKILRIDKPLFDYLYTLGLHEKQPDMYKEPIQVYSNVEGGLGVVGSCFTREIIMDFRAKSQK